MDGSMQYDVPAPLVTVAALWADGSGTGSDREEAMAGFIP
jgi:hypothetical protein